MNRTQKTELIASLKEKLQKSALFVFTDFKGMTVAEMTKLRSLFRKANVEYKVVKNTLLKKALQDLSCFKEIEPYLNEMTAVALSYEDPTAPAKVIFDFKKQNEKLKVKCGFLEGRKLSEKEVELLAKLPGKDELRSNLILTMKAPVTEFVKLLKAPLLNFVYLLQARQKALEKN